MPSPPQLARSLARPDDGTTLLEIALVLPVAVILLFGAFQTALALFSFGNAVFACRVAARYASLHSSASTAPATPQTIQNTVLPLLFTAPANASVQSTWTPSNSVGSTVTVTVTEALPFAIPLTSVSHFTVGSTTQRTILR